MRTHYPATTDSAGKVIQAPIKTLTKDVDSADYLTPSQIGMRRILDDWMHRGIATIDLDPASGRYGVQIASHQQVRQE